jgi:hypothetical protein
VTLTDQGIHQVRADKTGTANYETFHRTAAFIALYPLARFVSAFHFHQEFEREGTIC